MIRKFINANHRLCWKLHFHLPQCKVDLPALYSETVGRLMNERPNQVVVDVGGGRGCPFAQYRDPSANTKIVAVDVSPDEICLNQDVDDKRVADITQRLPFNPEEVDLIVSRSVVEHLSDVEKFIENSWVALKPGGYTVHFLPSRFAPFSIANQILPNSISKKILEVMEPHNKGICGFLAHYDQCYYSAITRAFRKHGFEVVDVRVNYYASEYFGFFAPLYLVSVTYEMLVRALGLKNLAASLLVVARKVEGAPVEAGAKYRNAQVEQGAQ